MSGSTGEEAMAAYKKALETISVKKIAPKATVSDGGDDDDVQFIRTSKRKATTRSTPSASKKKAKSSEPAKISPMSSDDHTKVLANLNAKVFPSLASHLQECDPKEIIQTLQGDLLQVWCNMLLSSCLFPWFLRFLVSSFSGDFSGFPSWRKGR